MKMKKFLTSALLLLNLCNLSAQSSANRFTPLPMDPAIRYGILPNGLTYYIRQNKTTNERADFYIVQNVGGILEEDSQNGLAHFLEHMAFQGTKNLPDKTIIDYLETVGVKFGANINAYTALDETVYNLDAVPTYREGIVDTALLVLHDWSGFLTLSDKEIDNERGVIREEWRTRNQANRRLWTASLPILFKNSQYAKRNVIGDTAIINNFAYDTLRAYYHKWYRPDLQAIIVVGDINADTIESKVKRLFADIPKRANSTPRPLYQLENNKEPIVAILTDPEAKTTQIDIDYRHEPLPDIVKASEQGYFISTAENLIISMINDRFDDLLQQPQSPLASASSAYGELVKSKDAFSLYAIATEGKEKEAFDKLVLEAERLRRFGFTQSELDRAKANLLSSMEQTFNERNKIENNSFVQEYQRNFLDFEPIPGIEWEFNEVNKILPLITLEPLNEMLKENFFSKENITIEITGRDNLHSIFDSTSVKNEIANMDSLAVSPYIDKTTNEPLISKTPKKGKIKKITEDKVLDFTQWTLSNGMKVVFKPTDFKDDEILMYAYSNGGYSVIDTKELASARLSCSIIENNGLGNFNATELKKMLAGKMVSISPRFYSYEHSLSGATTVKDFSTLTQLFNLYFNGVRSDENGYNSIISQFKTALTNRALDPNSAFSDSVNAVANGHNPRTLPLDTLQLQNVKQDEALNIFKRLFANPADFTMVLVGNINSENIKNDVLTYLGGIKGNKSTAKWIDRGIRTPQGQVDCRFQKELQTQKTSNFVYYTANIEPTLKNKICMQIIKGILSNRYLESLRESEGGTYGVSTYAGISNKPVKEAYIEMTFDTDPKMEEKLLPMIQQEIDKIIANGPLDEDFKKTKEILNKHHKEAIRENGYWQNIIASYLRDNENNETGYEEIVNSITRDDVTNMLKEIMRQGNKIKVIMEPK